MYTNINFKTKKELKEAVISGDKVTFYQPGLFGGNEQKDGMIAVEGPHYPKPHRWYALCKVENGLIVSVKQYCNGDTLDLSVSRQQYNNKGATHEKRKHLPNM